jgi:hypothetical protein
VVLTHYSREESAQLIVNYLKEIERYPGGTGTYSKIAIGVGVGVGILLYYATLVSSLGRCC